MENMLEIIRNLILSLGGGIVVVNLIVHGIKALIAPDMRGRWTQTLVFLLSVGMAAIVVGVSDTTLLVKTVGEIFAGAVALDQVTSLTARGKAK